MRFFEKFFKKPRKLETSRLILRPWKDSDAPYLYKYAQDKRVGPNAGWNPHKDVEESRLMIHTIFNDSNIFAVIPKDVGTPVGCIGITIGSHSNLPIPETEGEIGYWIGVPYWGKGMIPEATREIIRYGFEELNLDKIWCGYFDGNDRSKRVQEKCGFTYSHTLKDQLWETTKEVKTEHITLLTREDYYKKEKK